jgi:hypothetical protein
MLPTFYCEYLFKSADMLHVNSYGVPVHPKVRICNSVNVVIKMLYVKEKRKMVDVTPEDGLHMNVMNFIIYKLLNL